MRRVARAAERVNIPHVTLRDWAQALAQSPPEDTDGAGFHGTDAESFADAIHAALALPAHQEVSMRRAARARARDKFSEAAFERAFARGWGRLSRAAGVAEAADNGGLLQVPGRQ